MKPLEHLISMLQLVTRAGILLGCCGAVLAQPPTSDQNPTERERQLLQRIQSLEERLAALEARLPPAKEVAETQTAPTAGQATPTAGQATPTPGQAEPTAAQVAPKPAPTQSATGDSLSLPGFAKGTTINALLDGYYEYNFNRPLGGINLLRAFDPTSNTFTVNQAALVIDRPVDVANGRRLGYRLDLLFGQATETLSGNPANEPRPMVYRNILQAYGTYAIPLGRGLNVDFGRFASSLGPEFAYAKDQMNYTRSLFFFSLPFYHSGFRTSYPVSEKATFTWWLVNGINQAEDFNGFKSNYFMFNVAGKSLNWTANYYTGVENRSVVPPPPTNDPPPLPTQPGLSTDRIFPRQDGRTHIADMYLTWKATPNLTFLGEGTYVVSRQFHNSAPVRMAGGAGYAKYQFVPKFYMAGRFEYLSDHGFVTGMAQAIKEGTLTLSYQPAPGFQVRWEFRRDFSNQPFFLTSVPGVRKKFQTTAAIGLLWWWGGKDGAW